MPPKLASSSAPQSNELQTTASSLGSRHATSDDDQNAGPEGQLGLHDLKGRPGASGELAYFLSIPWCCAHLQPAEKSPPGAAAPRIRIVQPENRRYGRPPLNADGTVTSRTDTLDNAFSTTLNTLDTIGAFLLFYEEPGAEPGSGLESASESESAGYRPPVVELKALMHLGPGLNGHLGISHGGFVAAILDEVLGLLVTLNRRRAHHNRRVGAVPPQPPPPRSPPEEAAAAAGSIGKGFVTGYLNTTYVRPVRTSQPVLVTTRYVRGEGSRKFYCEGAVWNSESQLLAKADCLFIVLKQRL